MNPIELGLRLTRMKSNRSLVDSMNESSDTLNTINTNNTNNVSLNSQSSSSSNKRKQFNMR